MAAEEETAGGVDEATKQEEETGEDMLTKIFHNYESDVKGKMLSKYFGQALAEASIHLPDVEVRDLTFLADPKSCGWINKDDFIKVMNVAREQQSDAAKLRDLLSSQAEGSSSLSVEELTAILKESKDFEEADVKEWEQVLESFKQTKLYQKEEKVDAEDLVRALLHPESKGSDTPLDALSLNLAQ